MEAGGNNNNNGLEVVMDALRAGEVNNDMLEAALNLADLGDQPQPNAEAQPRAGAGGPLPVHAPLAGAGGPLPAHALLAGAGVEELDVDGVN